MHNVIDILFGLFGLATLIGIAWLFSNNRRAVNWRLVLTGIALQIGFAALVLRVPGGREVFNLLGNGFVKLLSYVTEGSRFIFGSLMDAETYGFIFAFQVLPTIIFFAALMGVLYHLGVMQAVVRVMALAITKVMKVSGAETTSVCASVFIGQTEAPLTVRPYIGKMTESELMTMMIGGMAHIAGGVLAAYVGMLGAGDPVQQAFYAKHLLAASIMAAPATMVLAKLLIPETGTPLTLGTVRMEIEKTSSNVIDAAASGAADGLRLALNIGAMLLAFIALIALIDGPLTWIGTCNMRFCSTSWAPLAWVIGVPWQDATVVGGLIGQKVVINEFVAYLQLAEIIKGNVEGIALTDKGRLIATYALCGFANFSSIAIQIGGIGGLAPERRGDLARLGLRAVLGGSLATFMTATIAGVLTSL